MSNNKTKYIAIFLLFIFFLMTFCYINNNVIEIKNIDYVNNKIPAAFDGFKILQVSDLHNKEFNENQSDLVNNTNSIDPDIIVLTGDIVDKRRYDIEPVIEYISQVAPKYPIYFVSGNHEMSSNKYDVVCSELKKLGVHVIDNDTAIIEKGNARITLLGAQDISFMNNDSNYSNTKDRFNTMIGYLKNSSTTDFNILLSHRPEEINTYVRNDINLVFSGHAHGGQVRLPLVGGIYAPHQGLFPKYTNGIYKKRNTSMVVSRGLGNSRFPLRIFNLPELVVVTLYSK